METSASEGLLYQAIVALEIALDAFERSSDARVRPEGTDDLEIEYRSTGVLQREHIQIKKPRQTDMGARKVKAWRLLEVCDELLGPSFGRLVNNSDTQVWILGDELDEASRELIRAGALGVRPHFELIIVAVHAPSVRTHFELCKNLHLTLR